MKVLNIWRCLEAKASCVAGGNRSKYIEVALMIDNWVGGSIGLVSVSEKYFGSCRLILILFVYREKAMLSCIHIGSLSYIRVIWLLAI